MGWIMSSSLPQLFTHYLADTDASVRCAAVWCVYNLVWPVSALERLLVVSGALGC
jgi:HEAT repeat